MKNSMQYAENESINHPALVTAVARILNECQFCGQDTRMEGQEAHIAKFVLHRCKFRNR